MRHNLRPRISFCTVTFPIIIDKRLLQLYHLFTELKASVMVCQWASRDTNFYVVFAAHAGQSGEHVVVC